MPETPKRGYISCLVFNNGETVEIRENDIVLFVGPNNAGKSQSLKDIYTLAQEKRKCTVIADEKITMYGDSMSKFLDTIAAGEDQGKRLQYDVLGKQYNIFDHTDSLLETNKRWGDFRSLFIANIDTQARLSICLPPKSVNRDGNRTHPIHYAAFNSHYRKWLSNSFKKAFNEELIPDRLNGANVPLCIGAPVILTEDYEDEQSRQEAYSSVLQTYKQVQDQGDGIKSFTGILLYLMLDYYCTYLIDEPESFLHPPQARIMGQIIGETLSDQQQAFISTHSEDIIKGLLETCPERLKIIRITREGDTNSFSILGNEAFGKIWADPLLKHSNIMSSLFHRSVVLCESDSDCQMYSIIENHVKQTEGKYSEALFVHCGGKQRMPKIISALRSLNISIKVIPDIDVLNDENTFRAIVESCGLDWNSVETDYHCIVSNVQGAKKEINRLAAKAAIDSVFDSSKNKNLSSKEIGMIQSAIKEESKWENIKKAGASALPAGDATAAFGRLNQALLSGGIHIVPVGELECFIKEVGGHGPNWVNAVIEKYPDLNDPVFDTITSFIKSLNL